MSEQKSSRREFIKTAGIAGAAVGTLSQFGKPVFGAGPTYKVALIGCGGRGNGALMQHVNAAKVLREQANMDVNIEVVAIADFDKKRAETTGSRWNVPKERCYGGPTAYKKVMESDADHVLMATPPIFRPVHIEAAVEAGKHIFAEKPVGVDPEGCRRVIAAGKKAKEKKKQHESPGDSD